MKVYRGEITRLIINLPPRYTKTELAVINFIAWAIAKDPKSKFIHLSYSGNLALENSDTIRNIIKSPEYQSMWPVKLKADSDSKQKWWTVENGGIYATAAGGQVTGFGAGHMVPGFSGAIIIDDAVKPDDVDTEERIKVNNRFNGTIKSRLAHEKVPIIVIMQRLHKNDLSGFLLRGGNGEKWHHLNLEVKRDAATIYNKDYTHGVPMTEGLKSGWLWPTKHNEKHLPFLKSDKKVWFAQYQQAPEKYVSEGALWQQPWIDNNRILKEDLPELEMVAIGCDPSGDDGKAKGEDGKKKDSDPIGLVAAGMCKKGHIYILEDATLNGSPLKWGTATILLYNKHLANAVAWESNYGGDLVRANIRACQGGDLVKMVKVTASRGKLIRAEPVAALYENNKVHHVGHGFTELEDELTTYAGKGTSPNRLDALVWVVKYLTGNAGATIKAPEYSIW